jgi:hypothetical protein
MLRQLRSRVDALASLQEVAAQHASELSRLHERIDHLAGGDVAHLRKDVVELRRAVLSHVSVAARALRQAAFFDEQAAHEYALQRLINRAKRTGRPVVAGPWTGEIGFELLYWIPFLRKLKSRLPDHPLLVVSRGGTSGWYAGIATGYQEIFDLTTAAEFRAQTERETRKQRSIGAFDRRLLRDACQALGVTRPVVVHPSLMYRLVYPYWKDQLAVRRLYEYLEPSLLTGMPGVDLRFDLPGEYVAARFYFSQCFPDTPSNRTLVAEALRSVSGRIPVVLLNMPFAVDDHVDAAADVRGVHSIGPFLTPENNLAIQTAVIGRARAFIGTYGGFSYLAPLCGVPSVTFYSQATFFEQHLEFARRTFASVGAAPFIVLQQQERTLVTDLFAPPARVG